jgi:hypothetical protein
MKCPSSSRARDIHSQFRHRFLGHVERRIPNLLGVGERTRRAGRLLGMSELEEAPAPRAHARVVYLGPVSPHWEVYGDWGDRQVLDDFRARALARLVLLPRDDPQFRRNKERINRDAERELISLEWELGLPDAE